VRANSVRRLSRAGAQVLAQASAPEPTPEDASFCIGGHEGPTALAGGLFFFVLHSCQFEKRSPCPARRAEHTSPPRILLRGHQRRFRPRNRRQNLAALQGRGPARSPAPAWCAA
jgi:hypothetical protein